MIYLCTLCSGGLLIFSWKICVSRNHLRGSVGIFKDVLLFWLRLFQTCVYENRSFMPLHNLFHQFISLQEYTKLRRFNISQYVAATRRNTISSSSDLYLVVTLFNNALPTA